MSYNIGGKQNFQIFGKINESPIGVFLNFMYPNIYKNNHSASLLLNFDIP